MILSSSSTSDFILRINTERKSCNNCNTFAESVQLFFTPSAKVATQLQAFAQEKSYCFQTLCESCAKVANGVDLPFASQQNLNDSNGTTLFSMSERQYSRNCYVISEDGNGYSQTSGKPI